MRNIYQVKLTRDIETVIKFKGPNGETEHETPFTMQAGIRRFNNCKESCVWAFSLNDAHGANTAILGKADSSGNVHFI